MADGYTRCIRCDTLHRLPTALVERNGLPFCRDEAQCTQTLKERAEWKTPTSPRHRAGANGERK